jgi:hypothetical protein
LENISPSSVKLNWEVATKGNVHPVETYLFNRFFAVKGQMEQVQHYAKSAEKPIKLFL